jgi:hypothetical protein
MANLKQFDTKTNANAGVEIELKFIGSGAPSGAFIRVLGTDSDAFRDMQLERAREALDREAKGLPDLTPEERDERGIKTLARCTLGWRGLDGIEDFSIKAAENLYREYPAIREQVNIAIANRANFSMG